MALSSANITAIENIHGPDNLYQWTNPHGTVTSTATAVLQNAVDTCVEHLTNLGYEYVETDEVVYTYCVIFLQPGVRDDMLQRLSDEFHRRFPQRKDLTVSTSSLPTTDSDSRAKFDQDSWDGLGRIGTFRRGFGRGGW